MEVYRGEDVWNYRKNIKDGQAVQRQVIKGLFRYVTYLAAGIIKDQWTEKE